MLISSLKNIALLQLPTKKNEVQERLIILRDKV